MAHTQKRPVATGFVKPTMRGMRGVVIYLDDETFATVRQRAIDQETSFGEQIRQLVEWGLMA